MDQIRARRHLDEAAVAHLATVGDDRKPHLVPVTFARDGDTVYFAVDQKPKRTADLQRLRNIAANPAIALLVDQYDDDWRRLWWVRVDGRARVLDAGPESERALDLLANRYRQYREQRPRGPVVAIAIERLTGWAAET
jgi:PPOX class probable F420-dependent enzyme